MLQNSRLHRREGDALRAIGDLEVKGVGDRSSRLVIIVPGCDSRSGELVDRAPITGEVVQVAL